MRELLRTTRRGVTLAEAIITIVLVGVLLVAAINTLGVSKAGQQIVADQRLGRQLAEQLMGEILKHPYADASSLDFLMEEVLVWETPTAVTLGPEGVEGDTGNRSLFDDIDDFHGWTSSPPEDTSGKPLPGSSEYERQVYVTLIDTNDADLRSAGEENGSRRVEVVVRRNGVEVERLATVVALGPTPKRACFLPDGSCMDLPASVCDDLGGTAQGAGSLCAMIAPASGLSDDTRPMHHWKMDDGSGYYVADDVGGIDLSISGDASSMWKSGVIGTGLYFDGGDMATSSAKLAPPHTGTVAFWMRSPGRALVEGDILGTHKKWKIRYMPSGSGDGVPGGVVFDLGVSWLDWGSPEFATSVPLDEPGRWYHLAATYDEDSRAFAVYIDGVEDVTGSGWYSFPSQQTVDMGADFEGVLDDVRIYDRVLTTEEIAALVVPAPPPGVQIAGFSEKKAESKTDALNKWPIPAGTVDGDLLIATLVTENTSSGTHSAPAGWNELLQDDRDGEVGVSVWWKIAASEPSDYKFQWSQSRKAYGYMSRITGHDPADPIDAWTVQTTGSGVTLTPTAPSATSSVDDALVLRLGAFDEADIVEDAPGLPGHVVITMDGSWDGNGAGKNHASGGSGYRVLLGAGASGSSTFSLTSMEEAVGITVLIKPAPSVEVGP